LSFAAARSAAFTAMSDILVPGENTRAHARSNRCHYESTRAKTGNLTEFLCSQRSEKECAGGERRKRRSFFSADNDRVG
jgi:hypothetical protein